MTKGAEFIAVTLLKRDVFSETQAGHFADDPGTRLTRRRLDRLPLWSRGIGRYLAGREARALERLTGVEGVPRLVRHDRIGLVRSWVEGTPLQLVGKLDRTWTDDAHRLLREIHRQGITHNDLAKPQNWLVTPDGRAAVIDMQLATIHRRRGRTFRTAKYEDLRHLLKQKQRFAPDLLTPTAHRLLAERSGASRAWRATFKPIYNFLTRRLFNWSDTEGAGPDLAGRKGAIREALAGLPDARDVAVAPFRRAAGTGLYAFVEWSGGAAPELDPAPDLLQCVETLPRGTDGRIRDDILSLIAENRVEELDALLAREPELEAAVRPIANNRLNLTDRYIR